MKKITFLLIFLLTLVIAGCGDRFAKEKEEILKNEQAAMAMDVPVLENPNHYVVAGYSPEQNKRRDQYWAGMEKVLEVETIILEKMRKSDVKIAEMESKANDSEKKDLKDFKDKVRAARINFVKKVSGRRLDGDPVIVGIGSTWQEVEMVYGKPGSKSSENDWYYDGLYFYAFEPRGASMDGRKFKSTGPMVLELTGDKYTANSGLKIGMTREEVRHILRDKYVHKNAALKGLEIREFHDLRREGDHINFYAMKDTVPVFITLCVYKDGKLVQYGQYPN